MNGVQVAGLSLLGGAPSAANGGDPFRAVNPVTGREIEPSFISAQYPDVFHAAELATAAAPVLTSIGGNQRATFLRTIAAELSRDGASIVERAQLETGLPLPRLQGELARTTVQLRLFADVIDEGSWVDARIDEALPDRKPLPRPDIRSMLRPLGPVAVFGASNFPLAFSVAGGDTASAFAAGNPVIVKAHPAHPGTSELAAHAIVRAARICGLPGGVFSLLFDKGVEIGVALVQHPAIKAVAFTGSASGGQALIRIAAARPEPIPCYAEMGSTNPLFILPGALRQHGAVLAQGLQNSFTLGSGQFCTKPGLVFLPDQGSTEFLETLRNGVSALGTHGMLTPAIAERYNHAVQHRLQSKQTERLAGAEAMPSGRGAAAGTAVFSVPLEAFANHPTLEEEIFGPTTLLIHYGDLNDLVEVARRLHGHLTATIHGTDEDLRAASDLVQVLETKVGRLLFNGYPTGVEVCPAMVHGGPFPATSDVRSTSVGTRAMLRFSRPVCYQDFPDTALPAELRRGNPLGIQRMVNGLLDRI
ncbi:MAG TPA: aldehyde dehydrogenase (NADP(+)) [Acidobacteriaceae bacterium]|jgi:NADP-dependent aldehyde dehydrogenase|nr:aldehyde dehydrogenase (NADP(+)) [Acidobacteriaceae bacterium]